jgi:arginine kinase
VKVDDGKTTAVGTQLTKAEDVVDFPVFPEGTKSLLSKHLSK